MIEHAADSLTGREPGAPAIRPQVFILSDVRLLRDGLLLSLSQQPSVVVVGAMDLSTRPAHIVELGTDVLLLDVGASGALDAFFPSRQLLPDLKVIAIAVADVEQDVFACAQAGVSGFVSRNGSIQDVVRAIHCVMRDELACPPRIAALVFSRVAALGAKRPTSTHKETLTRREHEIIQLISEGLTNKEIARRLAIGVATTKSHVHNLLAKLGLERRNQAAKWIREQTRGAGT